MHFQDKLNAPFPYYLNDDRKNLVLIVSVSLFVTLFLHFYKAHSDLELTFPQQAMFGGITFVCLYFNIVLLPKIFPEALDPLQWTVKKYIYLNIWHLMLIGAGSTLLDVLYICPERPFWETVVHAHAQVVLKGVIPIALITLFLKNQMLRNNLDNAIKSNRELDKISTLKKAATKTSNQVTIYSDTSETLSFHLSDLLFIQADDNYSTIIWENGHGVEKKLLRVNLKSIENQLDNSYTIRCHRSFIVNVHAISNIAGNTNGYKLQIRNTDYAIPVSRTKGKEVMDKIRQLRNMMELYPHHLPQN
jgi:hypothetical protein